LRWEQRGSVPAKYWKKLSKIYQVDEYTFAKACLYERYGLMTPIAVEMKVRGLFGKDIVDVIGVSGTAVFMWMKGKFYPSIENTIKLAYMFKIDPLDFMRMNIEHKVRVKELKRDECS